MSKNRYRIQTKLMIGLLIGYACCIGAYGDSKVVIYPRAHSDIDRRTEYPAKLLELALKQVDSGYTLLPTAIVMQQDRALKELSNTRTVDVVWSMTSIEREQELLPIRIPIHRGLIGWRLFLIKQSEAEALSSITTASQLKKMILLQGQHWPDTTILQASGFTVMSSVHYDGIFDMLVAGRGQLFPRSILEIWPEAEVYADKGIIVEPKFVLRYPTAFYYFVSQDNTSLATAIETGLQKLLDNGEFDHLFQRYYGHLLSKAKLADRIIIDLENPILPKATPLDNDRLWYR